MAEAPVHIAVLLDRSGSMSPIRDDVVGGFEQFISDQRADPSPARVTLVQFDSQDPHDVIIDAQPLDSVDTSTVAEQYNPRGGTPLLDAAARLIRRLDDDHLPDEDRVVAIITDGFENASRTTTLEQITRMIETRQQDGWAFVFLGAGLADFGATWVKRIPNQAVIEFLETEVGVKKMWSLLNGGVANYRMLEKIARDKGVNLWEDKK